MSQFSPNNKINNQPLENTEHKLDMSVNSYDEHQNVTHSINGRSNSNATSIPRMLSPNEAGGTDELSSGVHANPPMSHNSTARAKAPISQAATDTAHSESRMCAMDTLSKTQMLHTDTTSMQSESRMCTVDLQTSISDVTETAEQLKSESKLRENWKLIERRKRRNKFLGRVGIADTGPNGNFKAADINLPVFIYNVAKTTLEEDIIEHVYNKTQLRVSVQKMKIKVDRGYDSYKVLVPKESLTLSLVKIFGRKAYFFGAL